MLIQEGRERSNETDLMLGSILAFVAGCVNSAGFLAYQYFSANMTGNLSMASELLSMAQPQLAFGFFVIVIMFISGAFLGSLMINLGKSWKLANIYAVTLIVEALLLVVVGLVIALSLFPPGGTMIVAILSVAMGIQNAASTQISGSRVRTTHVSGVATDIGVGLAMLLKSDNLEKARLTGRLKLHLATLVSFALGGVTGVLGYVYFAGLCFCVFAIPLFALGFCYLRQVERVESIRR